MNKFNITLYNQQYHTRDYKDCIDKYSYTFFGLITYNRYINHHSFGIRIVIYNQPENE